jgi:hypothetical protein
MTRVISGLLLYVGASDFSYRRHGSSFHRLNKGHELPVTAPSELWSPKVPEYQVKRLEMEEVRGT